MDSIQSYKTTSPSGRHSNARNSSSSDEDSLISPLKSLNIPSKGKENLDISHRRSSAVTSLDCDTPGDNQGRSTPVTDIPSKMKSVPIPISIEKPARGRIYTPLTGREELPGGYFPNHEVQKTPLTSISLLQAQILEQQQQQFEGTVTMSSNFAPMETPTSVSTIGDPPSLIVSPCTMPEVLEIPKGKYYPSNYNSSPAAPSPSAMLNGNLHLPAKNQRHKSPKPPHQRRTSDIKRNLQKYQRDMIEQARMAAGNPPSNVSSAPGSEPISPRLLPLGSPGPITPFELEENAGYLLAGQRSRRSSLIGDSTKEQEAIDRMIRAEEERRRREGHSSPVARV